MFTQKETEYIKSQHLARIATVSTEGQPDVTPVGFDFDGSVFYVGGHNLQKTRKFRNIQSGDNKVALVVDDLVSIDPWRPRGIRIYGTADSVERNGHLGPGTYLRIKPEISWSWGLEGPVAHKTVHTMSSAEL